MKRGTDPGYLCVLRKEQLEDNRPRLKRGRILGQGLDQGQDYYWGGDKRKMLGRGQGLGQNYWGGAQRTRMSWGQDQGQDYNWAGDKRKVPGQGRGKGQDIKYLRVLRRDQVEDTVHTEQGSRNGRQLPSTVR